MSAPSLPGTGAALLLFCERAGGFGGVVVVVGLVRRRKGENKIGQLGGWRLDLEARAGQAQAELASNSVHPTRYQPCQPVGFFFALLRLAARYEQYVQYGYGRRRENKVGCSRAPSNKEPELARNGQREWNGYSANCQQSLAPFSCVNTRQPNRVIEAMLCTRA